MLHQGSDWFPVTTGWAIVVLASLLISQTFGSFASLTTLSTSSSIANITLVSNSGANYVDSGTNKWYCDNSGILSICVYLRIFNSNCYGKETIEITLQGNRVGGNTDLYSIFSMKNESDTGYNYFTFLSDWSGGVSIGALSGGVFIAPQCGLSTQLLNTADILDILDGSSNNNRDTVAGGDTANYQRLNDTNIGQSATYFYYRIENNNIDNRLTAYFNAEAINELSCQYGDSFDSDDGNNNDYIIAFLTDNGQVEISQVDINMTCQDATRSPTGQPTNVPSFTPSNDPTKEPTNNPSMNPSINPTNKPTSNPTIVPTDGPTNDPTNKPSNNPTSNPTDKPTSDPTNRPSNNPTSEPTNRPSSVPTDDPTNVPTSNPIIYPTNGPSNDPTSNPTVSYASTEGPSEEPGYSTTSNENDELSLINSDDISNYSISVFTTYFYNFIKNNTNKFDTIEKYILLYESAYDLLELYIENNQDSISNDISTLMELADLQEFVIQLLVNYTQMNIETNTNLSSNELFSLLSAMNTITLVPSNLDDLFSQLYSDSNEDSYYLYEIDVLYDVLSLVNNVLTDENLDTLSYDNATILINIINNIIELASYSSSALEIEYSSTSRDIFGDLIIEDVVDIGVLMLANAMVGEYYLFEIDENTIIKFAKINETIYGECQIYNNLQLSSELLSTKSDNGEYDIDCILMITSNDLYNLSILYDNDDVWVSNFLLVELMTDNYNNINNNDSDTSSATNSGDTTTVTTTTTYLSTCEPVILSYNKTNTSESWWNDRFPLCSYYNETTESYQTDGCYAIYNDDTTVQCACLHLTFYGNTWQEWAPEINYDAVSIFEDVSYDSLKNNPLGLVVTLGWIIVMCLLIFGCKKLETQCHNQCKWVKKDDRPFNQEKENNNNNNGISQEEYLHDIIYNINNDDRLPCWKKILCLWKLKILNNHLYIGLCCRNHGTNWTTSERILKLMIRVLVTIAVGALFYGIERDTFIGDATLVFWESTFGFWPVFIIIYIFRKMSSNNNNNNNKRNKKAFGYFWVMLFCLLCVIVAAIWCIYFDTFIEFTNSFQSEIDNSECIDNNYIDISAITWSNYNTTQSYIESELSNNYNDWYSYNTNDTSHESMAARFLLSILYCHLVAIIITQPIIAILLALRTFMMHRKKGKDNNNKETLIAINNSTNVNSNSNNGGTGIELAKSRSNSIVSTSNAASPTADFEDIDDNGLDHEDLYTNGEINNNNNNNGGNVGDGIGGNTPDGTGAEAVTGAGTPGGDDDEDDDNDSDSEGANGETKTGDKTNS